MCYKVCGVGCGFVAGCCWICLGVVGWFAIFVSLFVVLCAFFCCGHLGALCLFG